MSQGQGAPDRIARRNRASARNPWALPPNWLTAARGVSALAMLGVYAVVDRPTADAVVFGLFIAAAATDALDGWLARRFDQMSELGAVLDPLADKALLLASLAVLCVAHHPDLPLVWAAALVILAREIGVSVLRWRYPEARALRVSRGGKWKTAAQFAALTFLLAAPLAEQAGLETAGFALLALATWLSLATGVGYGRALARERRGAPRPRPASEPSQN